MAGNDDQALIGVLTKHLRDGIIQLSCTGTIIAGGAAYFKGYPKFLASHPKLLSSVAALVAGIKVMAFSISNLSRERRNIASPKDDVLDGRLKRYVKYLFIIASGGGNFLQHMYKRTILNSLEGVFNRLTEKENNYQLGMRARSWYNSCPELKIAPVLTDGSKVLKLTFPAYLKDNKTLCIIICSCFLGVIELHNLYEIYRCRCQIKRQRRTSTSAPSEMKPAPT